MATPRESYTPRGDTFIGRSGPYEHLQPTTPRPSSAPSYSATTRNIFPQRSDSPADTVTRPSTRHENKDTRNPITGEVREASKVCNIQVMLTSAHKYNRLQEVKNWCLPTLRTCKQ